MSFWSANTKLLGLSGLILWVSIGAYIAFFRYPVDNETFFVRFKSLFAASVQENRALIYYVLLTVLVVLLLLIFCSSDEKTRSAGNTPGFSFVQRMDPNQYELHKKIWTVNALRELKKSPEYRKYRKDKKEGILKPVELDGDDGEFFSDEQVEEENDD